MKNVWRKLFKRNRPLTNQHGPAKKVSLVKDSISRDDKGRWILDKTETSIDKFIAELTQELIDEGNRIEKNPVPKPRTASQKDRILQLGNDNSSKKDDCKCKDHTPVAQKPQVKKRPTPVSETKAVSKAKAAKPTPAKPTPKKPKSK